MSSGFAFFREPDSTTLQFCKGRVQFLPENWNLSQLIDGFFISPWSKSDEILLIQGEPKKCEPETVRTELLKIGEFLKKSSERSTDFADFEHQIIEIKRLISKGGIEKIVASRIEAESILFDHEQIYQWFLELLKNHQNALVALVYTPEFGLWMGATPEVLLQLDGEKLTTVSLAGTLVNQHEKWTDKEALEQSVTTRFIKQVLEKFGKNDSQSSEVLEVKSGNIRHLKSFFKVQIDPENIQNIIFALSPTPAVAGYPKDFAIQWLNETEGFNRSLFSGFWGMKSDDKLHLYVNLRCLQLTQNQHIFYAGCGINQGSDVSKEWIETEAKMNVTRLLRP